MTKQPHSATKLRLSKLFRWLAVLCFMKLTILGLLLLDVPMPSWLGGAQKESAPIAQREGARTASPEAGKPSGSPGSSFTEAASSSLEALKSVVATASSKQNEPEHLPQGAEAARLAAAAKPHNDAANALPDAALPAPLIRVGAPGGAVAQQGNTPQAGGQRGVATQPAPVFTQNLPEPEALPAPQAEPGTPAPAGNLLLASAKPNRASESEWLDALGLSHLPIPGLGSVQAAHAAALDMPVPQTPGTAQSPFTPAAQAAPTTIPGAPPIPAGIPSGQSANGAPLPPRGAAGNSGGFVPPLPSQGQNSNFMPVPNVPTAPTTTGNDPNMKAQELARQQQDILMLRQQMDQRLKDIQSTEKKMQDMIREARGIENEKIHRLVLTYSMMKPKAAAKALENMDERVAIRILSGMSPKQSGEILTYVDPAKTAKLTELITRMRIPD